MHDKQSLLRLLEPINQSHVLQFWEELTDAQRAKLAKQINSIDLELVQQLFQEQENEDQWRELASRADVPPAITLADFRNEQAYENAYQVGAKAIADGKIAMILTAGGQGSRLGFDFPKGMFSIGPISNRSLYQIIIERVAARAKQFAGRIPFYVMTSPPTHDDSTRYLEANKFFGYPEDDFRIFCQGIMPAVDDQGRLILGSKSELFESPDGHGGMLAGFVKHGSLAELKDRGIEHVFYGQVDNPLIQACDPALIGYHILAKSEMTSQVVRKSSPLQKVGNVVSVDGKVQIIEYSDLPEEFARQTNEDGTLKLWAGSIAVHIFSTGFLERTSTQTDALPFHRARKKVPFVNSKGELVQPDSPNAIKFERFIFDLLPWAENAIVCEVAPAEGFCAVKNAAPAKSETPDHVRRAIVDLHRDWLRKAGVKVADHVDVEICPFVAVDAREVKCKIDSSLEISKPTFLTQ